MLGILFLNGKGSFLIAGYNTASKAEKETIDERKLCNYVGKLMFLIAGCFLILMASDIFHKMWILWLGLALFFIVGIGGCKGTGYLRRRDKAGGGGESSDTMQICPGIGCI